MNAIEEAQKAAAVVAWEWLLLIDAGNGAESWNRTSPIFRNGLQNPSLFRAGVSAQQWKSWLAARHAELGRTVSRTLESTRYVEELTGEPDGEYVVLDYATAFEITNTSEVVVLVRESDGGWKVSNYRIRVGGRQT